MDGLRGGADGYGGGVQVVSAIYGIVGRRGEFIADERFGFGEGESREVGGVSELVCELRRWAWGWARGWHWSGVDWRGEIYLTTLMALGSKRWPLEGAIVVVTLELSCC